MTMTDPRIIASHIKIGTWKARDGSTYRAAYVGDCVLTGPEHASLGDDDLRAEAIAEAKRAEIYVRWRCTCGWINVTEDSVCGRCGCKPVEEVSDGQ